MDGVKCIGHNKQEGVCLGNTCIVSVSMMKVTVQTYVHVHHQ